MIKYLYHRYGVTSSALRGHSGILYCEGLSPMRTTATIMGSGRKVKRNLKKKKNRENLVEIKATIYHCSVFGGEDHVALALRTAKVPLK